MVAASISMAVAEMTTRVLKNLDAIMVDRWDEEGIGDAGVVADDA